MKFVDSIGFLIGGRCGRNVLLISGHEYIRGYIVRAAGPDINVAIIHKSNISTIIE